MSFSMYILCQLNKPIPIDEIVDFFNEGPFLDDARIVNINPDAVNSLGRLTIKYDTEGSIELSKIDGDEKEGAIMEALESLNSSRLSNEQTERIQNYVLKTKQVIEIEINRKAMTEESWSMLDSLEAYLLQLRKGVLYVYNEGLYGPDLKLWSIE